MITIMYDGLAEIFGTFGEPSAVRAAGEKLFFRGDRVSRVFFLQSGEVRLMRTLEDGRELVQHRQSEPGLVAEASVYSREYHCDAVCASDCRLRSMPLARFQSALAKDAALAGRWSAHLARSLQTARFRSEILTMKRVGERLAAWLDWNGGDMPPKGDWKNVAAEIGVSPEALYRELARLRSHT